MWKTAVRSVICLGVCFLIIIGIVQINYMAQQTLRKQFDLVQYAIQLREGSQYLTSEAITYVYGEEYTSGIETITADTETFINGVSERVRKESRSLSVAAFIIECLGLVMLLLTIRLQFRYLRFVRKELLEPIEEIRKQMIEISGGNFHAEFLLEENESEVGTLAGAIFSTKTYLQHVIGEEAVATNELLDAVKEVSTGTKEIAAQSGESENLANNAGVELQIGSQ